MEVENQYENSVNLSTRLINDTSVYAKRSAYTTIQTYEFMRSLIGERQGRGVGVNKNQHRAAINNKAGSSNFKINLKTISSSIY